MGNHFDKPSSPVAKLLTGRTTRRRAASSRSPTTKSKKMTTTKKTTVLVCGGGNAAHVLAAVLGSKSEQFEVRVLTMYADEAERWSKKLDEHGGKMNAYLKENDTWFEGTPTMITKDPAEAVPGAEWVILALPSTLHSIYINVLAEHCTDAPVNIGALSPHGGFDLGIRVAFEEKKKSLENVTIFGTYELPWACRIEEFGHKVSILGIKKSMELVVTPPFSHEKDGSFINKCVHGLQDILEVQSIRLPALICEHGVNFLPLMLDGFWHGAIMYGEFKDWDGKTPFTEKPLFYQGVSDETGQLMVEISDECMAIKDRLHKDYPALDLSYVVPTQDWVAGAYGDMIGDKDSGFGAMLRTCSAYDGLTHPMVPAPAAEGEESKGWLPDWRHRYMVEDLYMGIINIRSMGELAGVPTPKTDEVIAFCEKVTGAELMKDGKLAGKDLVRTRTPQCYGYHDIKSLMKAHYPSLVATKPTDM